MGYYRTAETVSNCYYFIYFLRWVNYSLGKDVFHLIQDHF